MGASQITKVRYELADHVEGFVVERSSRAATQTLRRMLARQKALGHRVHRHPRADGLTEYLVTTEVNEVVARYWLDPAQRRSANHA